MERERGMRERFQVIKGLRYEGFVAIIALSCAWVTSAQLAEMAGHPPLGVGQKKEREKGTHTSTIHWVDSTRGT